MGEKLDNLSWQITQLETRIRVLSDKKRNLQAQWDKLRKKELRALKRKNKTNPHPLGRYYETAQRIY